MILAFHLPRRPSSSNRNVNHKYQQAIREAAEKHYGGAPCAGPLYSRIVWFHKYRSSQGDADNIAKRIHDAMKGVVFEDDGVITHTLAVRVDATMDLEIVPDQNYPNGAIELIQSLSDPSVRDIIYVELGEQTETKVRLGPLS